MREKILVAERDALVAQPLQQTLQKAGFDVDVVADGKTARDRLAAGAYKAIITDWMMPELDGIELVRFVRQRPGPVYAVLITELNIPAANAHALAQGADAFFVKPVVPAQVLASLVEWLGRAARGEVRDHPAAAVQAGAEQFPHPVAWTEAWQRLRGVTQQVLAETLQLPLEAARPWDEPPEGSICALLPMVDVEHLLDLHVIVEAPRSAAAVLARVMLGDDGSPDEQTLRDVVAELANITAGCIKATFSQEAFVFTLGLAAGAAHSADPYALAMSLCLAAPGLDFVVRFGVRARQSAMRAAADLREGMVLADNVLARSGGLLLPAGTRLTATAAELLKAALGESAVRVCVHELASDDLAVGADVEAGEGGAGPRGADDTAPMASPGHLQA